MPVTIKVNGATNSLVHKGSSAISAATVPDVCKTPSPGGPVPIPYPNISQSATLDKGTTTVKADGGMMIATKGSEFALSNGDNAGVAGGVKSSTFMKESTWILYSFDVKMDGSNACRLTDKKFQNHENTVDLGGALQMPVAVAAGLSQQEKEVADCLCDGFCDRLKKGFKKGPKGGYRKKLSFSRRHNWSKDLEDEIKTPPPGKSAASCLQGKPVAASERFPKPPKRVKTIPDVNLKDSAGQVTRCFDFKFPGDRLRGTQRVRQEKLAGGKKLVVISAKTCDCN
ncbi:MAG: DUF4150 domain-containing protein [Burkholderiales bacterium]|nr:DUF4150 domain-containing protein [Burkholderiales bacterium]